LAQADVADQHRRVFLAEAPHLVVRAAPLAHFARFVDDVVLRGAAAMDAHDRAERAELEPAHEQLPESRVGRDAAVEAADVGGPPRDAREPDAEPRADLLAQILPGGEDIAAPHERPVALAAHPGAADQADDVLLPARVLAFIDHARVLARVEVADLEHRPGHVAVLVIVIAG